MNREKRKRGLQSKPFAERLETRWLMHTGFGPWGALRLLEGLEARGDHRFEALYDRLSAKFERWAARHPIRAELSGVSPALLHIPTASANVPSSGLTLPDPSTSTTIAGRSGHTNPPAGAGVTPDGGVPPPNDAPVDKEGVYLNCNCDPTVNETAPMAQGGPGAPGTGAGGSDNGNAQDGQYLAEGQGPMDSDASLITGEYLQDHQLVSYQSQGVESGIDLQYSSLQADALPIVTVDLTTLSGSDSSQVTTITYALTIDGQSVGSKITYDDVHINDGETYLVDAQVSTATSYPTGIHSAGSQVTKYFSNGTDAGESYTNDLLIVNDSASPYGAGWTIGGLQTLIVGTAGSKLMITDGSASPEEFTSTDGVHYTGDPVDTSTLVYSSSSHTYTRTYVDGTTVVFNSSGQETSTADRNGNTTSYAYMTTGPATGAVHTITDPVGLTTTLTYDSYGHLSTVTDPAGRATTFTIGSSSDNLTEILDPDSAVTQYGYNSGHEITTEINPDDQTATVTYDSFGRMSSETLLGGSAAVSITPAQETGLVAAGGTTPLVLPSNFIGGVTDPDSSTTSLGIDSLGGVTSETDGRGNTTSITRNSNDWPVTVTDALDRTTTYQYDSHGDVTKIIRPDGSAETLAYNSGFGIPTEITDFNGLTTTFTLDSHGNVTQRTDPDGLSEHYTYNSAGEVLTDKDPLGNTTSYAYDTLGRLTTITYPGTGPPTVVFGYDQAGDVTSITDPVDNTTTITYNQAGQILTEQDPVQAAAGKDTAYAYDAAGNLVSITDALGHTTTYAYNARNEVISITDALDNTTTYGYDADGNNVTITDPLNGTTTYVYDADNDLVSMTDPMDNTTTYVYDADDEEINQIDPLGNTTTYSYNNLGELSTVVLPGQTAPTTYTYLWSWQPQVPEILKISARRVARSVSQPQFKAA